MIEVPGHFLFLGTGGSMGIPVIGCHCAVCRSESPCNQRLRPSGLLTIANKKILIDCGPDFRLQAIQRRINHLDGLIVTHSHHDHIAGIDELRAYLMQHKTALPCLLSQETATDIKIRYPYIFREKSTACTLVSRLDFQLLEHIEGETSFQGIRIRYISYEQLGMQVNGFRIGNFAYVSDIRHYSDTIFPVLDGVETLVLSALRHTQSVAHFNIEEAIQFANRVGAKHTWLTHIAHDLEHEETNAYLPHNIRMAYDGLELNFIAEINN